MNQELVIKDIGELSEDFKEEDMLDLATLFKRKRKTIFGIPTHCYLYGAIITSVGVFGFFIYQNRNDKSN
jgi:hypothetical protein